VKAASIVAVEISAIDTDGFGVGTLGDRTVHVKGALPGSELQRVRVVKRRRGHWYGWIDAAGDASPAVPCAAFPRCGGCASMHLAAGHRLTLLERDLLDRLAACGVEPTCVVGPYGGPQYFYRRRARLGVRHLGRDDETLVGFRETFGSRVARVDACPVLAEPLASAFPLLKRALGELDGRARIPQVEMAAGDLDGVLVVRHIDPLSSADRARLAALERASGLAVVLQGGGTDSLRPLTAQALPRLSYRLDEFGVTLEFGPLDFVQVNGVVNRALVATAVAWLAPRPSQPCVDVFSGIGNFAHALAARGAAVTAIEASPGAVDCALANARRNGLDARIECLRSDLYGRLDIAVRERIERADAALVDPPRTGLGALIETLPAPRLARLVYVSCHPRSFVEDAACLERSGFRLQRLALFDMFPHTAHVETLALFERR
jgi:23S rRNA (uracil1939-C5)-methyltransferase